MDKPEDSQYTFGILLNRYNDEIIYKKLHNILSQLNPEFIGVKNNALLALWGDPMYNMNGYNSLMREILEYLFLEKGDTMLELSNKGSISWIIAFPEKSEHISLSHFDYSFLTSLHISIDIFKCESFKKLKNNFVEETESKKAKTENLSEYKETIKKLGSQFLFLTKCVKDESSLNLLAYYIKSSWRSWKSLFNSAKTVNENHEELSYWDDRIEQEIARIQRIDNFKNSPLQHLFPIRD